MQLLSPRVLAVLMAALLVAPASGLFMPPSAIPLERLLRKAEEDVAGAPKDAARVYTLARVHYLAFVTKRNRVPGFDGDGGPRPPPAWMDDWETEDRRVLKFNAQLTAAERFGHAVKARERFGESLRLKPDYSLAALGLASLLEQVLQAKSDAGQDLPKEFSTLSSKDVWNGYARALQLGAVEDRAVKTMPASGFSSLVSYEAASALLRLAKGRQLSDEERKTVTKAQEQITRLEKLPMGVITPIVFALQPIRRFSDLLAEDVTVDFKLRGYGFGERWPWVRPELGFLAWDPQESGRIESGQQLFGSYTFQIFWPTGYHALATLDDNRDGTLSGAELKGLSVWFDRNSDGRTSTGEVVPLHRLGVVALQTSSTAQEGKHPMNPRGITFADGRVLPTWDWVVEPIRD